MLQYYLYVLQSCGLSLQLSDQWGTVSHCFIAWLSAMYSPWVEEKKEGRKRGRAKEVERRKIFPRLLGFSWPRILWVKFKAWSTCLALFKFAKETYFLNSSTTNLITYLMKHPQGFWGTGRPVYSKLANRKCDRLEGRCVCWTISLMNAGSTFDILLWDPTGWHSSSEWQFLIICSNTRRRSSF